MQTCQHISIIQQQQQNNAADKNRTLLLFTGPDSLPKHTHIVVRNKQKNGILKTERKDIVKIIYDWFEFDLGFIHLWWSFQWPWH